MSRKILGTYSQLLAEADELLKEDRMDAEDRAAIQSFYNGRETMSASEAERRGVNNIVNHLLGFDSMAQASAQIFSIYTKGKNMWKVECPDAPLDKRQKMEMCVTKAMNCVIKSSRRFKPEWKALSGELPLFGNATLAFRDNEDWCPRFVRPFVPRGTGILSNEVPYCVIPDYLTLKELREALHQVEYNKKNGYESYWKEKDLRLVIQALEMNLNDGGAPSYQQGETDPHEEMELQQAAAQGGAGVRTRIPVYYFYVCNMDKKGMPFDMIILPRLSPLQNKWLTETKLSIPECLYERKEFYDKPHHFLHPFFVDCQIGGKTTWHRVMGLGRLNYEADVETEEFFNEAMQGSRENLRRLYQVGTAADWDLLKTWANGDGPSNVLPPGVSLAEANKAPNFQYAFTTMDFLMNLTRRNAGAHYGNLANNKENELEINALERQSRNAEALASRFNDIYECSDALGIEILRRLLASTPLPQDSGYDEIKEFQAYLKEEGINLGWLRKEENGKLVNVVVKTSRAAGDGDRVKQVMANQMLMQRLPLFSGEAQQIILRRITAEETEDYDFAEEIVPYEKKPDQNQVRAAAVENGICEKQGIMGVIPQLAPDDIDDVHIQEHLKSMQSDVARGKVRQWDQVDLAGFKSKGGHTMMHIQKMKGVPELKENVKQYEDMLQSIAKQGQEFENNLKKAEEGNKLSEKDKFDMQMQERQQGLKERQQVKLEEHRAAALDLSERKNAVQSVSVAKNTALQEDGQLHNQMMAERDAIERAKERTLKGGERAEERTDGPESSEEDADNPVP